MTMDNRSKLKPFHFASSTKEIVLHKNPKLWPKFDN